MKLNKSQRILIADPEHFERMRVERALNALKYYRIAPVQNLAELISLIDYSTSPFDVLILNAKLLTSSLNVSDFLGDHSQVRHALIYNALPTISLENTKQNMLFTLAEQPEDKDIRYIMTIAATVK